jgi:hypothetical protein
LYPHRRWEELGRRFLGRLTDLEVKAEGDKSMSGKRWPSGGVQGGVPQGPRDMARAGLPEAQSPVVNVRTRRNDAWNRRRVMSGREPVSPDNFRDAQRRPVRAVKGMNGRPTSRSIRTARCTTGSPTGREPRGDGVPMVVAGVTTGREARESRDEGERAQVFSMSTTGRAAQCRMLKLSLASSGSAAGAACRWKGSTGNCSTGNCSWWPTGASTRTTGR